MRKMYQELRSIFAKYSNETLAQQIVECLKEDGVVNVLYMQPELIEELNGLEYIKHIKKGSTQVSLEV